MIYAIDTEFIDDGSTIDLLSIGVVCEDGRACYVQNADCKIYRANAWVRENVLPQLSQCPSGRSQDDHIWPPYTRQTQCCFLPGCPWQYRDDIGQIIQRFVGTDPAPIFWGYYCSYDWVALCQLFGTMMELPTGWPRYCRELRQHLDEHGFADLKQPDTMPHHSLEDAQWIMEKLELVAFNHGIAGLRMDDMQNVRITPLRESQP